MSKFEEVPASVWEKLVVAELVHDTQDVDERRDAYRRVLPEFRALVSAISSINSEHEAVQKTAQYGILSNDYYLLNDADIDRLFGHLVVALQCRLDTLLEELQRRKCV